MVAFELTSIVTIACVACVVLQVPAAVAPLASALSPLLWAIFGIEPRATPVVTQTVGPQLTLIFTLASLALSVELIHRHLRHYVAPTRQRFVIRILLMVPIYAVDSLWAYAEYRDNDLIAVLRDTYESYVLANFLWLLLDLTGGEARLAATWREQSTTGAAPTMNHMWPANWVYGQSFTLDAATVRQWRLCIMQYVLLSPFLTLVQYVGTFENIFHETSWSIADLHIHIAVLRCVSVTFAFTALLYMYMATKKILHEYNPTGKFVAIKLVVFLSFWQSIVIGLIGSFGLLPTSLRGLLTSWSHEGVELEDVESSLENLLLCAEMFVTAMIHNFVFSPEDFTTRTGAMASSSLTAPTTAVEKQGSKRKVNTGGGAARGATSAPGTYWRNFIHAFSVIDVVAELLESRRVVKAELERKKRQ